MDPRNRNNIKCNLPVEEVEALKELIKLQKDRVIVIKPCDKCANIIILDFNVYMQACYDHLLANQHNENGEDLKYYDTFDDLEIERSKRKINSVLKKALEDKVITNEEFKAMDSSEKNV